MLWTYVKVQTKKNWAAHQTGTWRGRSRWCRAAAWRAGRAGAGACTAPRCSAHTADLRSLWQAVKGSARNFNHNIFLNYQLKLRGKNEGVNWNSFLTSARAFKWYRNKKKQWWMWAGSYDLELQNKTFVQWGENLENIQSLTQLPWFFFDWNFLSKNVNSISAGIRHCQGNSARGFWGTIRVLTVSSF